ncbi:MAG TPA: hypothetical protein VJS47_03675 [Rhizomicrobium sp.]|nr:hypothetical protein [Rhizomicrobium sp.]
MLRPMITAPDVLRLRIKIGLWLVAAMVAGTFSIVMHLGVQRAAALVNRVPEKAALQIIVGQVVSHKVVKHVGRYTIDRDIHLVFESQGKKREFKLRNEAHVRNALCNGCKMVLWQHEDKIWQFSVRDKIVRSYGNERKHYIDIYKHADPEPVRWSALAAGFCLAVTGFWWWRLSRAMRRAR